MSENHVHGTMESALAAVRERLRENERRDADERAVADARLLTERDEAPPRTGSRRGTGTPACPPNRREHDAKRHSFRAQALIKVIDEAAEPYRGYLLEACDCVLSGDREGFAAAMSRALTARALEVVEWRRGVMVADLLCGTEEKWRCD